MATATLPKPTTTPIVAPGDRVYFWTTRTGTQPHTGRVVTSEVICGVTYAEIVPDLPPHRHVYLFPRAVWGFERMVDQ